MRIKNILGLQILVKDSEKNSSFSRSLVLKHWVHKTELRRQVSAWGGDDTRPSLEQNIQRNL